MKKKLRVALLFVAFVAVLLESCNNIFHDLLPPPNNEIISFAVQYSDGTRSASSDAIENQTITVTVPDGTDLTNLIPVVTVSEKATVIPGTLPYLNKVFPERDLMHLAVQMNNAFNDGTFKDWFLQIVLESDKVSIPRLDMPVDFSVPVFFCVISGDGNYKLYTVKVLTETEKIIEETGEIPPGADNFILSFEVPGQRGTSVIIHEGIDSSSGTVDFVVEQGTNIRSLLPTITVSEGAKIIPLTMEYIMNCGFTFDQMLGFYTGFSTATDIEKYVSSFLRRNPNIVYPEITTAIDFSSSVPFAVVGSDGGVRIYNVNCSVYDGTPKLEKVYFSKANNPYLIKDFECESSLDSFIGQATYPDEMELDYGLIADIVFIGEKATYSINGGAETEIISGVTSIPFTNAQNSCDITVYRDGITKTYNLTVERFLDPDTIRSITDYRFKKQKNSDIKNTVIASIYNEGDTGYISATVLYEGSTAPYDLVVDFISPGTVTTADTIEGAVPGTVQSSGVTSNNFQYSRKFLCTSRNGLYTRLYTVNIEFVQVIPAEVAIKSFAFPVYLNGDLSQDAVATINDADGSIRCQVTYASENVPKNLVAEFSATGAVTCSGITQTSGYTANNFTYSQYYTVTVQDEYYGTLTKNYKVEVVYKKDNDSACELLTFGFATEDNPTLTSDVNATVTQRNGSVYAFMPFGAGATEGNALVPYFTAEGTVSVNGTTQTSGASGQDFSSPVTYTVTSANGRYTKDYTVTLQESGAIIYVDCEAYGLNNGTSWQDAFISLDKALEQAASAPEEVVQELWVAAREEEYIPIISSGFKMRPNLIIRGGFNGTENAIEEREKDIDGNLVKRTGLIALEKVTVLFNPEFSSGTFELDGVQAYCGYLLTYDSSKNFYDNITLKDCYLDVAYRVYRETYASNEYACETFVIENCTLDGFDARDFPVEEMTIKNNNNPENGGMGIVLKAESICCENNLFDGTSLSLYGMNDGVHIIKNGEIKNLILYGKNTEIEDCKINSELRYSGSVSGAVVSIKGSEITRFATSGLPNLLMLDTNLNTSSMELGDSSYVTSVTMQDCTITDGYFDLNGVESFTLENSSIGCGFGWGVESKNGYISGNTFTSNRMSTGFDSLVFVNNTFANSNFEIYSGNIIDFSKNNVPSGELLGEIRFNRSNTITNTCSFENLTVDYIYSTIRNKININNCKLRYISCLRGVVIVTNCEFPFDNTYVYLLKGSMSNCTFTNCTNLYSYLITLDYSFDISNCTFENIMVAGKGLILKNGNSITNCTFTNCSASSCIVNTSSLEDCVFQGCTVTSDTSFEGIVYSKSALNTIKGCQFYDNTVVVASSGNSYARGGIVYFMANKSSEENPFYSLEDCTFKGNQLVCKLEKTQAEHTFYNDHGGVCVAVEANKDNTTLRLKDCVFEDSRLYFEFTDGTVSPENKNPNHIWMSANYKSDCYNECKIILEGTNTYDTLNGTFPVFLNGVGVEGSWQ